MKEIFEALADWIMAGSAVDLKSYGFDVQNLVMCITNDGTSIDVYRLEDAPSANRESFFHG